MVRFALASLLATATVVRAFAPPRLPRAAEFGAVDGQQKHSVSCLKVAAQAPAVAAVDEGEGDEAVFLDFDGDDEDFDLDAALSEVPEWDERMRQLVASTSRDPAAVDLAAALLDERIEAYVRSDEDDRLKPTAAVYNDLIRVHAYSKAKDGAEKAEEILDRMETQSENPLLAPPDADTYVSVLDAYAMRRSPDRARAVLDRQRRQHERTQLDDIYPSVRSYNKVIKAHGMAGEPDKAEGLLRELLEYELDQPEAADHKSFVQVCRAYAAVKDKEGARRKIQSLIDEMEALYDEYGHEEYRPKTEVYNSLLRCLPFEDAEARLYDMIQGARADEEDEEDDDVAVVPNANSFRSVLYTLASRRDRGASAKAMTLLQLMKGMDLEPDTSMYHTALSIVSKAIKDSRKARRAKQLVEEMEAAGDRVQTSFRTYYLLLVACAHVGRVESPEERLEIFQVAAEAFQKASMLGESSSCYGMFLRSARNLMSTGSKQRDELVQKVFEKCCASGLLDEFVLNEFESSASEQLQLQVLGGFIEDGVRLPDSWSANVKG